MDNRDLAKKEKSDIANKINKHSGNKTESLPHNI